MKAAKPTACVCCHRPVALTFHHLIPKKMHRRKGFRRRFTREDLNVGIWICRQCHRGIHAIYDELTLAKQFYTLDLVLADPALSSHFAWTARQREASGAIADRSSRLHSPSNLSD